MENFKNYSIVFIVMLTACLSFGQIEILDIDNNNLNSIVEYLKSKGAVKYDDKMNLISGNSNIQTAVYKVNQDSLPDLTVKLFFTQRDSLLTKLSLEWDNMNFNNYFYKYTSDPKFYQRKLFDKYVELDKQLSKIYTSNSEKNNINGERKKLNTDNINLKASWKQNSNIDVKLFLMAANPYQEKAQNNYPNRLRLFITKTTDINNLLTSKPLETLVEKGKLLINLMNVKDYDQARFLLSDELKAKVPDEEFVRLSRYIDFTKQWEMFENETKYYLDGRENQLLRFKGKKEKKGKLTGMIIFEFNDVGEIVFLKPISVNERIKD